jgi:hypothetical protein
VVSAGLVASWDDELVGLLARIAGRVSRVEPRKRAFGYVRGLLAPLERRNGWTPAEAPDLRVLQEGVDAVTVP